MGLKLCQAGDVRLLYPGLGEHLLFGEAQFQALLLDDFRVERALVGLVDARRAG